MFSQTQHSFDILYLLTLGWATCFDSLGIIIRPSLKNIKVHYIKLLKRVLGSQTFTINIWLWYICLC